MADFLQYQLPPAPDEFFNKEALNQFSAGEFPSNIRMRGQTAIALGPDVTIGAPGLFYTMRSGGIFSFGNALDGNVTISSDTTLTADKYYDNLTVNSGITLTPAGFRIFVQNVCTIYGTITGNGNTGGAGANSSGSTGGNGGTAGAALADGYLKGALAGRTGGAGGSNNASGTAGTAGVNTSNSIGSNGVAGGAGGSVSGGGAGGAGGTAGTATASNVELIANWQLVPLLDIGSTGAPVKMDNSASSSGAGGGGGASNSNNGGGGGGGSGSGGRIIAIYARQLTLHPGSSITANGGNGGAGGNSAGTGADAGGPGGGGGGGNGGQILLVYNRLINNGTITASGGTGGVVGTGGTGTPVAGTDGVTRSPVARQFEISL